mgnify:CR=1 FL=1
MVWTSKDHFKTLGVDDRLIAVMKEAFETYPGHYTPAISEGVRTEAKGTGGFREIQDDE